MKTCIFLGLVLGIYALVDRHVWGIVWGFLLVSLGIPVLDVLRREYIHRNFTDDSSSKKKQRGCKLLQKRILFFLLGTIEFILIFIASIMLLIRVLCTINAPVEATMDQFPFSCTGAGAEIGCTRLVNVLGEGNSTVTNTSLLPSHRIEYDGTEIFVPQFDPLETSINDLSNVVEEVLDEMPGFTIKKKFSDGSKSVGFHATRKTSFMGFVDDIWVMSVLSDSLVPFSLDDNNLLEEVALSKEGCPTTQLWVQGQLRIGQGDMFVNWFTVQSIVEEVHQHLLSDTMICLCGLSNC